MHIRTLCYFFSISLLFSSTEIFAQKAKSHALTADEAKVVKKDAGVYFNSENYNAALPGYRELRKSAPDNAEYNYRYGVCLLMTNSDKSLAVEPLEFASNAKDPKKEVWYYLGMAYMHKLDFSNAIDKFTQFKSTPGAKLPKSLPPADQMIEWCENGQGLVANPVNVTFENLGKMVNTIYDEYNPMISADGKQLVFTTRRKGNIGGYIEDLGMFSADAYWTTWKDTVWTKSKGLGTMVNTDWDEECVGITQDGNQLLLYFDNIESYADIGRSTLKGKMWQRPEMLAEMNTKNYEGGATISLDGTTLIFSCNKKDNGSGGSDLFVTTKDASGIWSAPKNLGPVVNSKNDEDAPFLSIDGKTLYFASKGWNSMGGFDMFKSTWDPATQSWGSPVNLGYPINDPDDNSFFSFTGDGRYIYASSARNGSLGERDIFRIRLNDTTDIKPYVLIQGTVASVNGGRPELTRITLSDLNGKALIDYKPAYATGSFLLYALPGSYSLKVEGYHFAPLVETIEIPEGSPSPFSKNLSVTLSK